MQKILIKNFFALRDAEFQLDKLLLLIGEQASGKSTVAKLVYFFKTLPREILNSIRLDDSDAVELSNQAIFNAAIKGIRKKFYSYFGSTRHLDDFVIEFFFSPSNSVRLSLTDHKKSLSIKFSPELRRALFDQGLPGLVQAARQGYARRQGGFDAEVAYLNTLKEIEAFVNELFENKHKPFYIPAGRNISVGFGELFDLRVGRRLGSELEAIESREEASPSVNLYLIGEFLDRVALMKDRFRNRDFEGMIFDTLQFDGDPESQFTNGYPSLHSTTSDSKSFDQLPSFHSYTLQVGLKKITSILKGRYVLDRYGEKIFFTDDRYVELNDASSGQQESIRVLQDLFLVLLDRESAFRVIEEPEAHLYPLAQKALIELIAIVLNTTSTQMIITTHSPYILSVLNNLLYATRVLHFFPKAHEEIAATIPEMCWLQPETFHAYALKDGLCQSIIDYETGLINQNFLDEISEQLGDEFNILYSLHAESMQA